jgi:cytochrome c oxidase subunit 3
MSGESHVALQFQSEAQQREAAELGMWVFLTTEIMLFGGVFLSILIYRVSYGSALRTASRHLDLWLGGANTAVLLTSSLTMVLAVVAAREHRPRPTAGWLLATAALGLIFLGIKGYEYFKEYHEGLMPGVGPPFPLPPAPNELFFNIYFAATGLHAFHLTCGIGAVGVFAWLIGRRRLPLPKRSTRVEVLGLYWHLVDIVWLFLYPALYLI